MARMDRRLTVRATAARQMDCACLGDLDLHHVAQRFPAFPLQISDRFLQADLYASYQNTNQHLLGKPHQVP